MASPSARIARPHRGTPWWDVTGRSAARARRRRLLLAAVGAATLVGAMATAGRVVPARGAGLTVNLDQWASSDRTWQNGNLNGNNSRYPEGGIVPFRLAIENLARGEHSIRINHDFTAGGHKAYDFLATWNATNAPGPCWAGGGGVSSMCPALPPSSSFAFPSDPFVADGLSVSGAQAYSGASRRLTIWGGTILSISAPLHAGPVSGNSTAEYTVRFRSTGSSVLLAWGGHLAQSAYWNRAAGGPADGAGQVSGAPWHMRTLQLDGSGNKNQDRSIQPSAIVGELPPYALAPTPTPAPPAPAAVPTPRPTTPSVAGAPPATERPTIPPTSTDGAEDGPATEEAGLTLGLAFLVVLGLVAAIETIRPLRRRRAARR